MKTILAYSIIVILIGVGGFYYWQEGSLEDMSDTSDMAEENTPSAPEDVSMEVSDRTESHRVTIETNFGTIVFESYDADAPKTVENFITLAKKSFYDGLTFHRVIRGFMIQGGDPSGNGTGGPGYTFEDELNPETESYKQGYVKGIVAMANSGPDTNGSQFFIMHEDTPLPRNYTIFGKVVAGQDVVDAIANVQTGANDKPVEPVIMEKVTVESINP